MSIQGVKSAPLSKLQYWWWPTFVFLYPLCISTLGYQSRMDIIVSKYWLGIIALIGGALIEWSYRTPSTDSSFSQRMPLIDLNSCAILAFGFWCLFASLFTNEPIIALTGSIIFKEDASIWIFSTTLFAWLIYMQSKRNLIVATRIFYAIVLS